MRFHLLTIGSLIAVSCFSGFVYSEPEEVEVSGDDEEKTPEVYSPPENSESFGFEAEVSKMLDIVVNSLYQNKDVFLRELISNASDALDKIRYLGLQNSSMLKDKEELEMRIEYDADAQTLTIRDSGVGMTKKDLIENLGTVARSGTTKFIEAMKEGVDMSMIGQFGVGFYSSFLVADRVRVSSKHPDDGKQHVWESINGESNFHVYEDPAGNTLGRGTEITLFLKDGADDYTDGDYLKDLVTHYSEFVTHPIYLRITEKKMVPVEYEDEEEEIGDADFDDEKPDDIELSEEDEDEDDEDEEDKEPEMEEVITQTWEQVNTNAPIWTRSAEDIEDDEYHAFYKVISKDRNNATTWTHFDAEGTINFKALLYMPSELPDHLVNNYAPPEDEKAGLNLYVKRVLISDSFELMPKWLQFVKGVVDSDDLPLNVNRETVQETKIIKVISKKLVRKVLEMLRKFADEFKTKEEEKELDENGNAYEVDEEDEDGDDLDTKDTTKEDKYIGWYKKFSPSLKMGVIEDGANRDRIMKLLRFKTSKFHAVDDFVPLQEYVDRMHEWQDSIYFFPGEKELDMHNNHFMDKFKSKDVEVLYLTDPVDEYMIQFTSEFSGKKFVCITKDGVKFGDEDEDMVKRRAKFYKKKFEPLTKYLKKAYGSAVMRVSISDRLENAPAMVSATQYGNSQNMERLMKAQAYQHGGSGEVEQRAKATRVFEINPRHPAIIELLDLVPPLEDDEENPFQVLDSTRDAIWLLHDVAVLNSGFSITNAKSFSKRMTRILKGQLNVDSFALVDEVDPPEEKEEADDFEEDAMGGINMDDINMGDMGGNGESVEIDLKDLPDEL